MLPGFLPFSRGNFILDFVAVAMLAIIPVMYWSIHQVRENRNYRLHKRLMVILGIVLLVAVAAFEIDIRVYGWRQFAEVSPYYNSWLFPVLYIHLFFSISTTLLWLYTIPMALKKIPNPPAPSEYSMTHKRLATWASRGMTLTAVTGWIFFYMAFIA